MKKINSRVGPLVVWSDYIKPRYNQRTDTVEYLTSEEATKGFSQRYIAVYMHHNKDIYIAVAVNKKQENETNTNWWKYILETRIANLISNKASMEVEDKGITMIPYNYVDMLLDDKAMYQNIYGALNLDIAEQAISQLEIELQKSKDGQERKTTPRSTTNTNQITP